VRVHLDVQRALVVLEIAFSLFTIHVVFWSLEKEPVSTFIMSDVGFDLIHVFLKLILITLRGLHLLFVCISRIGHSRAVLFGFLDESHIILINLLKISWFVEVSSSMISIKSVSQEGSFHGLNSFEVNIVELFDDELE